MWKPTTVEDIRAWFAGNYVPNPTVQEFLAQHREQIRRAREAGMIPRSCLVPRDHPVMDDSERKTA